MAFVPEDGSGLPNSNSYIDVSFADTYFSDRAIAAWAELTAPAKQAALIAATDYIDVRFGPYLRGAQDNPDVQALAFPRDKKGIPVNVKKATAEYAIRASTSTLAPDPELDPSGYQISERLEKVGPIEEKVSFATIGTGSVQTLIKPYPAADMLMRPFLKAAGGSVVRG